MGVPQDGVIPGQGWSTAQDRTARGRWYASCIHAGGLSCSAVCLHFCSHIYVRDPITFYLRWGPAFGNWKYPYKAGIRFVKDQVVVPHILMSYLAMNDHGGWKRNNQ